MRRAQDSRLKDCPAGKRLKGEDGLYPNPFYNDRALSTRRLEPYVRKHVPYEQSEFLESVYGVNNYEKTTINNVIKYYYNIRMRRHMPQRPAAYKNAGGCGFDFACQHCFARTPQKARNFI